MTGIYEYSQDFDQYQFFVFEELDDCDDLFLSDGPLLKTWVPPTPSVMKQYLKYKKGDFWNFGEPPLIVTQRAKDLLSPVVTGAVEWLPLKYQGEPFYFMNVLLKVDCVDLTQTKFSKHGATRKIHFLPDRLANLSVFSVPRPSGQWATDRFKDAVESAGLKGIIFKQVWKG